MRLIDSGWLSCGATWAKPIIKISPRGNSGGTEVLVEPCFATRLVPKALAGLDYG